MSAFDRISVRTSVETRSHVSKTLDIVERIQAILDSKGMTQKDLAIMLGKQPSEISRWMTGLHNFELKTLVKIEEALGEEIFSVAKNTISVSGKFSSPAKGAKKKYRQKEDLAEVVKEETEAKYGSQGRSKKSGK